MLSMTILEDFYYGNIIPNDKCFDPKSKYAKCAEIFTDNEEKLIAFLKALPNAEEEQRLLSQMIEAQNEINRFSEVERFIEGFRLGASFMLDTFVVPQQSVIRDII